jgi:hypothetical protein
MEYSPRPHVGPGPTGDRMMKKSVVAFCGFLVLGMAPLAMAGLATGFVDVVIDNLQPGVSYSMQKIFKMPYSVRNNGGTISIAVRIHKSDPGYLRPGYESPEDISWIRLEKTNFTDVKPGETVTSDIIISPPDDNRLLGKKIQISIEAETVSGNGGGNTLDFAVESRLRFSIAPERIKTSQEDVDTLDYEMSCKVFPENIQLTNYDIPANAGKQVLVGTLRLTNWGQKAHTFRLKSLSLKDVGILNTGCDAPPDPDCLKFSTNVIILPPQSGKSINAFVRIPDKADYYGKYFQFTVSSEIEKGKNLSPDRIFNRIFVSTKKR